jgi:hypothetical protein
MKIIPFFIMIMLLTTTVIVHAENRQEVTLKGSWVVEADGSGMLDPQTSGLKAWRGKLLSLSDASADQSQQKQLHVINSLTGELTNIAMPIVLSDAIKKSCFANYLQASPDLEGLAVDPEHDNIFYVVTEDARIGGELSSACQQRFKNTGSTAFPSLLLRLALQADNRVLITHVRPIQFDATFNIGNSPNDGIEGVAFGQNNMLYLALEKDSYKSARIFSLKITKDFWLSDDFIAVEDPQLSMPLFDKGNHPINGLDYLAVKDHPVYLVAAARNDNQLWFIDIAKKAPTTVVHMNFLAPTNAVGENCNQWDVLNNTSIEGVAVKGNEVWLINDPWKKHYLDNIQCKSNAEKFRNFVPLIFSLPINTAWLK